jgi:predicted ATPase
MKPWYVITGAPSSGKTTLIDALSSRGHQTVPEAARTVIDEYLARGRIFYEIRADEEAFQWEVLVRKQDVESTLPSGSLIFFDRGIPDTIAYYKACGLRQRAGLDEAMAASHYRRVFLLDPLDLEPDYARVENLDLAQRIDQELERAYRALGLEILRVPVLAPDERLQLVLDNL